jgi:hypothetical protein
MKQILFYYRILDLIRHSYTVHQVEYCERLINKLTILGANYLAEKALFKKVEILATQYPNQE